MVREILNAKITKTSLGKEDHGILTAYVYLEGAGWGCGFGGYAFDEWDKVEQRRKPNAYGLAFILRVMEIADVESWEKLPGTFIRVDTEGWGGKIVRIGHLMKDEWFDPKELAKEYLA